MLDTLGNHVHTHGITSGGPETNVDVGTSDGRFHRLEPGEARSGVECVFHRPLAFLRVKPVLRSTSTYKAIEPNAGSAGHTITSHNSNSTATCVDSLSTSRS